MPFVFIRAAMARSWLGRVYKTNRGLFVILTLFFAFSVLSNLLRLQTSPFFLWDMYSSRLREQNIYPYYEIRYNSGSIIDLRHTWNEPEKTYLYTPLGFYCRIRARHDIDPFRSYLDGHWLPKHPFFAPYTHGLYVTTTELERYPGWLKRYLSAVTGGPVRDVTVLQKSVRFDEHGAPVTMAADTVLRIP